jgi:uncharacterized protein YecE (DUF72 family)
MSLYLGGPIWAYKGWVGSFFPKGTKTADFLREYARRLNTVEGNTTFYATPASATLEHWAAETPPSFQFCPKLPRTISHAGKLAEHIQEAGDFLEAMRRLGPRLGPLFLQLPPRYPPALIGDLRAFLEAWQAQAKPDETGVRLAVEVRHTAWYEQPHHDHLNELLAERRMARVVIDTHPIRDLQGDRILEGSVYQRLLQARQRKPDLPIVPERTADFVFLRYIGHPQMEQNISLIEEWAGHLAGWLGDGVAAYVFCHCPDERLDPWLCREFHKRVGDKIAIQPLPWDQLGPDTPQQARLF